MKIAHLSDSQIPSQSANSIQVMKMCEAFVKLGHEVCLFAKKGETKLKDEFKYYGLVYRFRIISYRGISRQKLNRLIGGLLMARALSIKFKADLIYARETVALVASARFGIPMIFEAHELPEGRLMQALQHWLFGRHNFLRLVVITKSLGESYLKLFPWLNEKRILVAHSGTDVPEKIPLEDIINDHGKSSRRLQIGYIGQLYHGKGMEIVIPLGEKFPNYEFWIVGGPEEKKKHWSRKTINLKNIHFIGYLSPKYTSLFREKMDVLLAPTQYEMEIAGGARISAIWTSPLKLFEYMASAKPIISSDLPSIREVLDDGVNALLASPNDIEQWSKALKRLEIKFHAKAIFRLLCI